MDLLASFARPGKLQHYVNVLAPARRQILVVPRHSTARRVLGLAPFEAAAYSGKKVNIGMPAKQKGLFHYEDVVHLDRFQTHPRTSSDKLALLVEEAAGLLRLKVKEQLKGLDPCCKKQLH